MGMENYTLTDLATVTGGAGGFGGNSFFWIFALLILANGGLGGWNNRGDYGQFATAASQQDILFSSKFQALDNKIDRIGNGIADATFALNNSIKDGNYATQTAVKDGNYAIQSAVKDGDYATQTAIKDCCCTTQRNIDSVRFDMANYANAINSNIDNKFAALEKNQLQQTIQAQAQQISQLQLAQQMCGVVRYPNQMVYAQAGSPFCNYNGGGCGCGTY